MSSQWSYFVMVLCFSLTSSAFLDLHGDAAHRLGDQPSDVKPDEAEAPPIEDSRADDPGSLANDSICRELCKTGDGGNACLCDWPPLKRDMLFNLKTLNKEKPLKFIKFPTPQDDPVCMILCRHGKNGHFCLCP